MNTPSIRKPCYRPIRTEANNPYLQETPEEVEDGYGPEESVVGDDDDVRAAVADPTEAPPGLPRQEPHERERRQHHRQTVPHPVALGHPPHRPRRPGADRRRVALRRHRALLEQPAHLLRSPARRGKGRSGGRTLGFGFDGFGIALRRGWIAEAVRFRWLVGGRWVKRRRGKKTARGLVAVGLGRTHYDDVVGRPNGIAKTLVSVILFFKFIFLFYYGRWISTMCFGDFKLFLKVTGSLAFPECSLVEAFDMLESMGSFYFTGKHVHAGGPKYLQLNVTRRNPSPASK
jgi:hypothetical protein